MTKTTKRLCRAGVISALYVALTYVFAPFAFGAFQVRPSEALCILPLFFPEAIPALFVGCALSNLSSPYVLYDVVFGSLATLVAASLTYLIGRIIKKDWLKILLGGIFPVLINAFVLPLFFLIVLGEGPVLSITYFLMVGSLFLTESVWVYALGAPLYFTVKRLQKREEFLAD